MGPLLIVFLIFGIIFEIPVLMLFLVKANLLIRFLWIASAKPATLRSRCFAKTGSCG
jgi:Sec-independent protein secretion pathway component TatC